MRNHFFLWFKRKLRTLINRCPRRLRVFAKPFLGGLIGLLGGGIPGFFIGLLLGYLLGELFGQTFKDKKIITYLKNPGSQQFNESEPGLAAWCALAVLTASENQTASSSSLSSEKILKQVYLEACCTFNSLLLDPSQIEHYSRLAWSQRYSLNTDLLAESFASRRAPQGDARDLARRLNRLAEEKKAKILVKEIRQITGDTFENDEDDFQNNFEDAFLDKKTHLFKDPWKILGLPPGTPRREIKAHYRRLAKQFHPDELQVLDEKQRNTAAQAFMAIKEAYLQITGT